MLGQVEQEINKKIEREKNIIQGASQLKKKTDNVMVIQKCNTNIREAQQNIQYLEETLKKLQLNQQEQQKNDTSLGTEGNVRGYGQLSTISPDEHIFSRLDLVKYDCPSLSQRIQFMLQQLEFKLQVEKQYQEANDKLTKLYQIDGDQRSSSAAEGGSWESKQRIQLLTKALKKYQAINVELDQSRNQDNGSMHSQPKFRRKQLTGTLSIGITAIRDVDHIQSPLFSRKPETIITVKIDDAVRAKTKPSRNDRWHEEFGFHVDKGNEVEITVYDKINDRLVPVAVMWLLLSDVAEEIRKKKAGQAGQPGWANASTVINSADSASGDGSAPTQSLTASDSPATDNQTNTAVSGSAMHHLQSITASAWFVLEPAGQILLTLGFNKSTEPTRKNLMGGLHRRGAIINRKEDVYEQHGHHFVQKSFYNIMCCAYCGDFLRYTGFQCQDCKFLCHKKCYTHVVTKCIAKTSTDTDPDEAKLNHRIPHRFKPVSNRGTKWCCHCGYILPWGRKNVRKCSECGVMCHAQCAHLVPDFCGMSMEMANQVLTTIQDTKRSQEKRKRLSPTSGLSSGTKPDTQTHSTNKLLPLLPQATNSRQPSPEYSNHQIDESNRESHNFNGKYIDQQQSSTQPASLEHERHEKMNDRLNNFIEQNDVYQSFTNGAAGNTSPQLNERLYTLDPASRSESSKNGLLDQSTLREQLRLEEEQKWYEEQRTIELRKQQQMEEEIKYQQQQQQQQQNETMALETKQNPFNIIPSSEPLQLNQNDFEQSHDLENTQAQNNPFRESVNNKLEYLVPETQSIDEASELQSKLHEQAQILQEEIQVPQQVSPQKSHTSSRHRRRTPKRRKVSLDDFVLLKVLGKGNFGKVLLAKSKNTNSLCAIKVLKKDHIIKNHDIESARAEKKVFLLATKAKHPFLTNLYCSFQTENRIYFAMEFIGGGDLMWHVQNQRLSVRRAKFYAAEVLLALKYFHDNGVIYRDLKLENILLTPEGHIKIADYGLCKDEMWYGNKTSTFCGTPEFMAPEILKEQEYTKAVDWWAFGVLLYQMLLCQSPFSGDDEDEVFNAILTDEPLYPIDMAGDIVQIFQGLLTKDPERRLGAGPRDALEVMEEPFFRNISFDDILNLRIQPPYVPEIKAADDTSYFEKEFTSAPPTLTPLPSVLSSNLQEEFRGFSFMPDDLAL